MTTPTPASPSSTAPRCSCSTSCPTADELLVDGAEGRHAVDVLRLAPGRAGARRRRPRARSPRARSSPPGREGLRVAVSRALRGARARSRSSCWCRRCPRATAARSPSTWPPSSASTGSCPGRRRAASPAGATTASTKGVAKWRAAARAASKQSRRPRLPEVTEPMTTREVCGLLADADLAVVLHEQARRPLAELDDPARGHRRRRRRPRGRPHRRRGGRLPRRRARRPSGWAPRCCARPPPAPPPSPRCRSRTRWA